MSITIDLDERQEESLRYVADRRKFAKVEDLAQAIILQWLGRQHDATPVYPPPDSGLSQRLENTPDEDLSSEERMIKRATGSGNGRYTTDEIMQMTRGDDELHCFNKPPELEPCR